MPRVRWRRVAVLGGVGLGGYLAWRWWTSRPGVHGEGVVDLTTTQGAADEPWGAEVGPYISRVGGAFGRATEAQRAATTAGGSRWVIDAGHYGRGFNLLRVTSTGAVRPHAAVDITARRGTPIRAILDGTVERADRGVAGYGNRLVIRHGSGLASHYAHCHRLHVGVGDVVRAGQHIADVGNTGFERMGTHLHMSILKNLPAGARITTDVEGDRGLDPVAWLASQHISMVGEAAF